MGYQLREEVMTLEEIKAKSADCYVEEVTPVVIEDIIHRDEIQFYDMLEQRLLGDQGILTDIEYAVVGTGLDDQIHIKVSGFADLVGTEE